MKRLLKSLIITFVFAVMFLTANPIFSEASNVPYYDYSYAEVKAGVGNLVGSDVTGNYILISTVDLKKTSSVSYKTIGATVSRAKWNEMTLHNGTESEYFQYDNYLKPVHKDIMLNDGKLYDYMVIALDINKMRGKISPEWWEEIEKGFFSGNSEEFCYLKLDDIMTVCKSGVPQGKIENGSYVGKVYPNRPFDNNEYYTNLRDTYGWQNKTGIDLHYNMWVNRNGIIRGGAGATQVESTAGKPVSLYETKNYSRTYDISKAIPSSEEVINEYSASSIRGQEFDVSTVTTAGRQYSATYTYVYEWIEEGKREKITDTSASNADHYESLGYEVSVNGDKAEVYKNTPAKTHRETLLTETYRYTAYAKFQC